jgi:hypothetical protein
MQSAGGASPANEEWHFLQCFGERTPGEDIQEGKLRGAWGLATTGRA